MDTVILIASAIYGNYSSQSSRLVPTRRRTKYDLMVLTNLSATPLACGWCGEIVACVTPSSSNTSLKIPLNSDPLSLFTITGHPRMPIIFFKNQLVMVIAWRLGNAPIKTNLLKLSTATIICELPWLLNGEMSGIKSILYTYRGLTPTQVVDNWFPARNMGCYN